MPSTRGQLPSSWGAYERDRADSTNSSVQFNAETEEHQRPAEEHLNPYAYQSDDRKAPRRRSSMGQAFNTLRNAGGVNSLDNFARSWQRAVGFHEVTPVRQSFRYADDEEGEAPTGDEESGTPKAHRSLLRQQLEAHDRTVSDDAIEETDTDMTVTILSRSGTKDKDQQLSESLREQEPLLSRTTSRPSHAEDNIFLVEPSLASPFGGSYGSTWGSLSSRVNESSMRHAGRLFRQQQQKGTTAPDKEREPLIVKRVEEDDGKVVNVVIGQSTLPQTIFNSVNVLIGVGLLALPLAMRYAGWIPGLIFFFFAGVSTCYTAKLLAKCADVDTSLITFADLAYVSFGPWARIGTSILFSLELLAACVALVVLFADSLNALIPWGIHEWKVVCGIILIPLSFVPLNYLSFTSVLGILCCFGITLAVLVDGLIKPTAPGSLRQPAQTYLFPSNWMTLPISFGILMSPWGGHSVFPNIYRDMRHPYKYRRGVNITYAFTFSLDLLMAVIGLLMFGDGVKDEVTRNILSMEDESGYPTWLSVFIVVCVAIIPLTKIPLNARPIVSTLELFLGLDARALATLPPSAHGLSGFSRGLLKIGVRVLCVVVFVLLAILIPSFDTIMSLLGAVACFTICLILPCAFHLKLFGKELTRTQKMVDWGLIGVSSVLAVVSTAFNFVPMDKFT